MRLSCNGCRVLRKGCSEDCCIRPCLEWIKTPEAQCNATLFLAKFYGRAGLVNLINAASPNLRPAVFKSLLYEACGRIVNPVQGSAGLLWSGKWNICESAVEAALAGKPITPISTSPTESTAMTVLPAKASDIRHVSKANGSSSQPQSIDLLPRHNHSQKALKPAVRGFKRVGSVKGKLEPATEVETESGGSSRDGSGVSQTRSKSTANVGVGVGDGICEDVVSAETVEAEAEAEAEARLMRLAEVAEEEGCEVDVGLELTLGHGGGPSSVHKASGSWVDGGSGEAAGLALGLGVVCK